MSVTKVLVADDHGVVRKGLRFLLQTDPGVEVVAEACDGREAVRLTEAALARRRGHGHYHAAA